MTEQLSELQREAALRARSAAPPPGLHIPSLDGLRAVSFLIVFVSHAGFSFVPGGFGVTVFFFLSGYLITTLMRREVERTGKLSFRLFYLRRALRILPPFYLVLAVATALTITGVLDGHVQLDALLSQVLHYCNYRFAFHGWDGAPSGTGVYWSLAVEEHFYFVFPAMFMLLHRRGVRGRSMAATFAAICALVLAWRCVLLFGLHVPAYHIEVTSDTRLDSMLLGCALAVFHNPALDDRDVPLSPRWTYLFLPAAILALLGTFLYRADWFRESLRYTVQGIALWPIFVVAIRRPELAPFRLLNSAPLRRMGALSYSLYLVHLSVIYGVYQHVEASIAARTAIALVISFALAQGMFYLVEQPCARVRSRLRETSPSRAPAPTNA